MRRARALQFSVGVLFSMSKLRFPRKDGDMATAVDAYPGIEPGRGLETALKIRRDNGRGLVCIETRVPTPVGARRLTEQFHAMIRKLKLISIHGSLTQIRA